MAHALDVQPARSNVRGDQDVDRAVLELFQLGQPRALFHVAMDLAAVKPALAQRLVQIAYRRLAVAEDDRGLHASIEHGEQRVALSPRCDAHLALLDRRIGAAGARNLDRLGVVQELVRQLLDRRRHGRGKQQSLALCRQPGADRLDIGDESHVEHPVGLVDHQQVAAGEQDVTAIVQVHQAARRRDQHIDALFQRLDLIPHRHAADQQRHRELVILAVFLEILSDLRGEFARRLEDERARHAGAAAALGQNVDHRQHEARRLARPRLRDADQVAHHQHRGNGLRLNGRGGGIAGIGYGLDQLVGKAEIGKYHRISEIRAAARQFSSRHSCRAISHARAMRKQCPKVNLAAPESRGEINPQGPAAAAC